MSNLRIRVSRISDDKYPFCIQLSMDGLIWLTVSRENDQAECIKKAEALGEFIKNQRKQIITHILWTSRV